MNLGCLLWVIVGLIILWNISPGLVVVSVLGGIVAAIVKIKGSDIDEDKKNSKEDDDYFQPQAGSFPKYKSEEKYDKRLYEEIEEIKEVPQKENEGEIQESVYSEEKYEPKYKYCNNLTSSTDNIDLEEWDNLPLSMDEICGTWKYKDVKPIRTVIINSNMTYSDSITTKKKSYPFIVEGNHICFYGEDGKLFSSWKIIELSKNNVLHVILKHYFSGDMFKSLNRPFDIYLEKMGDSLL
jgi:hypothetical protein